MHKPRIVLTGGGTAGHVMPNLAIVPELKRRDCDIFYIGSNGIEHDLLKSTGIPFSKIASGKLRRYLSFQNFIDVFKVFWGIFQSIALLRSLRPQAVFSKGGFVSVPVCIAAALLKIRIVTHESDLTPGLANRIISRFADKILYTFPETETYLQGREASYVGAAVRPELAEGEADAGYEFCGFKKRRTTIMFMGGSLGSQKLNSALEQILPRLVQDYNVIHLTGAGNHIEFTNNAYASFEFIRDELADLFAASDIVVGRSGANAIFEYLSLRKPMLLVPLVAGSRGDQVHNAESFVKQGWARLLAEGELDGKTLLKAIGKVVRSRAEIQQKQASYRASEAITKIVDEILPPRPNE